MTLHFMFTHRIAVFNTRLINAHGGGRAHSRC